MKSLTAIIVFRDNSIQDGFRVEEGWLGWYSLETLKEE